MKIKFLQLPTTVQQVVNNNVGCQNALRNLVAGRPSTPRSWFYEHKSAQWCLDQVCKKLESSKDLKLLADWDLSFVDKFGPQGEAAPLKDRLDSFEEYFLHTDAPQILSDPMFIMAQKKVIKMLGFNESGSPLSVDQVVEEGISGDKYNTNSAYDCYLKKKNPLAVDKAKADASRCIKEKYPNTPGTRATPGKTGIMARNIFMTAFSVVLNGQRFQKPLQEYIRSKNVEFFAPWDGFDKVQSIASSFETRTWKLSADYDKMDQHFNKHHGKACFEVIKHYFKREYWDELEEIIDYVFTQPILLALDYLNGDSSKKSKRVKPEYIDQIHALVSGSEWTNFLETVWNLIFWTYMELKYHVKIRHKVGIGDDQLIEFESGQDWNDSKADKFLDLIIWNFDYAGTPGNKKKNVFSRSTFDFCQRKADASYSGIDGKTRWALVYRLTRCLEMNVWPESYHNEKMVENGNKVSIYNKYTFAIQVIMRSENCLYHWLLSWWIDFIWQANPAIKEFVALKDSEVLEQERRARKITTLYSTYNQEKADHHLTDFVVFKMLRQKLKGSTGAKA